MNKNIITGVWQKAKGKFKAEVGHAIGDRKLEVAGVTDQVKGVVTENVGKAQDAIKKGVDTILGAKEPK